MKFSYFNPDQITLIAESEEERMLLGRIVEHRERTCFRLTTWQLEPTLGNPMERPVPASRIDMRLIDDATQGGRVFKGLRD